MAEIQAYQQDKNSVGTPSGTSIELKEITRTDVGSKSYLDVNPTHFHLLLSMGSIDGKSYVHKFGNAPDFDTGDNSVNIWDGANDGTLNAMQYTYSTTANIDSISSGDSTDTQVVEIQGLDSAGLLTTQEATLAGSGYVALGSPLIRIFRMKNMGATDFTGNPCVYVSGPTTDGVPDTASDVRACINDGNNQTLMALYTVPANKTVFLESWFASAAGANKTTNYVVDLRARPSGGVFQLKHRSAIEDGGTSHIQHRYQNPERFNEFTDIEMKVQITENNITAASVSAGFDLIVVDN